MFDSIKCTLVLKYVWIDYDIDLLVNLTLRLCLCFVLNSFNAFELSDALTSGQHTSLQEAISFYETTMRERAAAAAKESLENGERMHSAEALTTKLAFFQGH